MRSISPSPTFTLRAMIRTPWDFRKAAATSSPNKPRSRRCSTPLFRATESGPGLTGGPNAPTRLRFRNARGSLRSSSCSFAAHSRWVCGFTIWHSLAATILIGSDQAACHPTSDAEQPEGCPRCAARRFTAHPSDRRAKPGRTLGRSHHQRESPRNAGCPGSGCGCRHHPDVAEWDLDRIHVGHGRGLRHIGLFECNAVDEHLAVMNLDDVSANRDDALDQIRRVRGPQAQCFCDIAGDLVDEGFIRSSVPNGELNTITSPAPGSPNV